MTKTTELLERAKEFVAHVSGLEKSGESCAEPSIYVPPAMQLRRRADEMDKRDSRIERARVLLKEIEDEA